MVRIVSGLHADEDCVALRDVPPGWTVVCVDGWYASPTLAVGSEVFAPLGPFDTAAGAVDAAWTSQREGRG